MKGHANTDPAASSDELPVAIVAVQVNAEISALNCNADELCNPVDDQSDGDHGVSENPAARPPNEREIGHFSYSYLTAQGLACRRVGSAVACAPCAPPRPAQGCPPITHAAPLFDP